MSLLLPDLHDFLVLTLDGDVLPLPETWTPRDDTGSSSPLPKPSGPEGTSRYKREILETWSGWLVGTTVSSTPPTHSYPQEEVVYDLYVGGRVLGDLERCGTPSSKADTFGRQKTYGSRGSSPRTSSTLDLHPLPSPHDPNPTYPVRIPSSRVPGSKGAT